VTQTKKTFWGVLASGLRTMQRRFCSHTALQDELQRTEELLRTFFNSTYDGILLRWPDGTLSDANERALEMYGVTREELSHLDITDMSALPSQVAELPQIWAKVMAGEPQLFEWRTRRFHSGEEFDAEVFLRRTSIQGRPAILANMRDITERKRAEAELRRSNAALESALAELRRSNAALEATFLASPVALVTLTSEMIVTSWNRAAERLFGWKAEEVLGRPLPTVPPKEVADATRIHESIVRGERFADYEVKRQRKDGVLLELGLSIEPLRNDDGKPIGSLCAYVDYTERKILEAQLLRAQKLDSIGRLAGGIAHDFNNLLTVINGYSDMALTQPGLVESVRANLQEIRKAGAEAANLTRQLLAFSRHGALQPKIFNINEVVEEMQGMLQRVVGEDVQVSTTLADDLAHVRADPGQLQQVIMNLVVNARDAMPRGGELLIKTANLQLAEHYHGVYPDLGPGSYVMLAVSDTGIGMDEELQRHIFDPFFTTKEVGKGTGLGLSTVWGIVRQNGGQIRVYSEPGRGTTFKVYLPRVDEQAEIQQPATKPETRRGSETILLVEDQPQLRQLTSAILAQYGYSVLQAANGAEALKLCKDNPTIQLVLTDVVMPGMTGIELGHQLQQLYPEMKILYMSGYTDDVIRRQGTLAPEKAYLEKPFSAEGLNGKIREILEGSTEDLHRSHTPGD